MPCVHKLVSQDGQQVPQSTKIAKMFQEFYGKLNCLHPDRSTCTSLKHRDRIRSYLAEIKYPKLSSDLAASFEKPITQEELENIIRNLPKGKSSGPDGI